MALQTGKISSTAASKSVVVTLSQKIEDGQCIFQMSKPSSSVIASLYNHVSLKILTVSSDCLHTIYMIVETNDVLQCSTCVYILKCSSNLEVSTSKTAIIDTQWLPTARRQLKRQLQFFQFCDKHLNICVQLLFTGGHQDNLTILCGC